MTRRAIVVDVGQAGRRTAIASALHRAGFAAYDFNGFVLEQFGELGATDWPVDGFDLAIVHHNDLAAWRRTSVRVPVEVFYAGTTAAEAVEQYWIRKRTVASADDAPSARELEEIVEWLDRDLAPPLPNLLRQPQLASSLDALTILCQGFMVAFANSGAQLSPACEKVLREMGWTGGVLNHVAPLEVVEQGSWWRKGLDAEQLSADALLMRMREEAGGEDMPRAVTELVAEVCEPQSAIGPDPVVACYLAMTDSWDR